MRHFAIRSIAGTAAFLLALAGAACGNGDNSSDTSATTGGGAAAPAPVPGDAVKAAIKDRTPEDPTLIWTPSSVVLVPKEIAPSVYAVYPDDAPVKNEAGIPVATSGGFIVGDHGVLVIESMINRKLAKQMIALVREVTSKPILYVLNTSYHGDHSYGNQFFPEGVLFIQHVETQNYIQNHFAADVAFMMQNFGKNQGLEELKPQPAQILLNDGANVDLDLGGRSVKILHLGFAQTNGDLFVWLPKEKIVYTGNPIISEGPSLPWLLDGKIEAALATLHKLLDMLPPDAIVVPGHGEPTDAGAIKHSIAYLEELKTRAADAVAKGLSEKETVDLLTETMKQYAGYKIYPWVHSQINVPKTYEELKPAP
jgi:cyclase